MQTVGKVLSNRFIAEKTLLLELKLVDLFPNQPKPFQFVMIRVPGVEEFPMSIADYEDGVLRIIYKVKGFGTESLSRVKDGFIGVRGPFGAGFTPSINGDVLFVAGGSGIAPLPYLSKFLPNCRVRVVWGVKTGVELFDVKSIFGLNNVDVSLATEDCSIGFCGKASDLFRVIVGSGGWSLILASGPKAMLREVCLLRKDAYVNLEAIVKCGLGLCGSCILKPLPKLLCRDGPVFSCIDVEKHLTVD